MDATTSQKMMTADEMLWVRDSKHFELVDGRLIERHSGAAASALVANILGRLGEFVHQRHLGYIIGGTGGYACFGDAYNVRKADVTFVRIGRFPREIIPEGHSSIPPDLAVEVVFPTDNPQHIERKASIWVTAGVPLVWVVDPSACTVRVHRAQNSPAGRGSNFAGSDTITGEEVLPGFSSPIAEFFRLPKPRI